MEHRWTAPERPRDAPPVNYGDRHPFDPKQQQRRRRQRQQQEGQRFERQEPHQSTKATSNHRRLTSTNAASSTSHVSERRTRERGHKEQHDETPPAALLRSSLDFQPIRIRFDTLLLEEMLEVALQREAWVLASRVYLLLNYILPRTSQIWSDVLQVIPVQGPLYPLSPQPTQESSSSDSSQQQSFFCPPESTAGIPIDDTDLWIHVTLDKFFCQSNAISADNGGTHFATKASALACERDQYDRPVTGAIDFCLDQIQPIRIIPQIDPSSSAPPLQPTDLNYELVESMVRVTLHELGHVLGMTSDSLPYFRSPITGQPYSLRPFRVSQARCVSGDFRTVVGQPPAGVLFRGENRFGEAHFEIRTPTVTRVVRNQFDCELLRGARLENQPTSQSDCYGSHWDERWFYNALMGAVFSSTQTVLTPVTLAFLEDSSWYRANYESEHVQTPAFGYLGGCDFVNEPCIVNGRVPDYGVGNFCNTTLTLGPEGFVVEHAKPQTCDPTHRHKARCDLRDVSQSDETIPAQSRRYFGPDSSPKVPYKFQHADFCPIPTLQAVSCLQPEDSFSPEHSNAGERHGPNSRCYDVTTRNRAICLESYCNPTIRKLQLSVLYGINITCQHDGQIHTLLGGSAAEEPFRIRCPKLSQICPHLICPKNCAGRGICRYDRETQQGRCECFDPNDRSDGCYQTTLDRTYRYHQLVVDPIKNSTTINTSANVGIFLFVVGSVIIGLVALHIAERLRADRYQKIAQEEGREEENQEAAREEHPGRDTRRSRDREEPTNSRGSRSSEKFHDEYHKSRSSSGESPRVYTPHGSTATASSSSASGMRRKTTHRGAQLQDSSVGAVQPIIATRTAGAVTPPRRRQYEQDRQQHRKDRHRHQHPHDRQHRQSPRRHHHHHQASSTSNDKLLLPASISVGRSKRPGGSGGGRSTAPRPSDDRLLLTRTSTSSHTTNSHRRTPMTPSNPPRGHSNLKKPSPGRPV